jgi:hypothetical protein
MFNLFVLSFVGSSFFLLSIGIIHLIRADLPAASAALSRYAIGPYGGLLTTGIYSIGLAEIFLSIGLVGSQNVSLGNVLLICAGISACMVATFHIEFPQKTFKGYLHDLGAGMQFLFFPFALLQLKNIFPHGPLYVFTELVVLGNFLLLLPIAYLYFTKATHQEEYFGLIQKTNIILMSVWVMVVSLLFI